MTLEPTPSPFGAGRPGLVRRAQNILLRPTAEWAVIDGEAATVPGLFQGYAVVLAAIGPVCHALGALAFGYSLFGVTYRPGVVSVLASAAVSYLLSLASVFVLGLVIEALAPNFGGAKDRVQAMKVAVYGSTASWLAGVFGLVPALAVLAIVGLYSLYLIYLGLPKLMRTPQDKALPYTGLVMLVTIVLAIVVMAVVTPLQRMTGGGYAAANDGRLAGQVRVGDTTVDLGKLQAATAKMEAQTAALQAQAAGAQAQAASVQAAALAGGGATVSAEAMKALLPAQVNGFARTEVSSESVGAAGAGMAKAEASYARGGATMKLSVSHLGALGGLGALAGAIGVNSAEDTATGYEKVSTVKGRTISESYDRAAKSGKYTVMAQGVVIAAEGENVGMDDLKAAVGAVNPDRVAALAGK